MTSEKMNSDQKATLALLLSMLAIVSVAGFVVWNTPSGTIATEQEQVIGTPTDYNLKTVVGLSESQSFNWTIDETDLTLNFTDGYWTLFVGGENISIQITEYTFTYSNISLELENGTDVTYYTPATPETVNLLSNFTIYGNVPIGNYTELHLNGTTMVASLTANYYSADYNYTIGLTYTLVQSVAEPLTIYYSAGGNCNVTSLTEITTYNVDPEDLLGLFEVFGLMMWMFF